MHAYSVTANASGIASSFTSITVSALAYALLLIIAAVSYLLFPTILFTYAAEAGITVPTAIVAANATVVYFFNISFNHSIIIFQNIKYL